jgi:hypothetical protein
MGTRQAHVPWDLLRHLSHKPWLNTRTHYPVISHLSLLTSVLFVFPFLVNFVLHLGGLAI